MSVYRHNEHLLNFQKCIMKEAEWFKQTLAKLNNTLFFKLGKNIRQKFKLNYLKLKMYWLFARPCGVLHSAMYVSVINFESCRAKKFSFLSNIAVIF